MFDDTIGHVKYAIVFGYDDFGSSVLDAVTSSYILPRCLSLVK